MGKAGQYMQLQQGRRYSKHSAQLEHDVKLPPLVDGIFKIKENRARARAPYLETLRV